MLMLGNNVSASILLKFLDYLSHLHMTKGVFKEFMLVGLYSPTLKFLVIPKI